MVFDYMGIHLDSNKAQDLNLRILVKVQGDEDYLLTVKSGVLLYQVAAGGDADITITLPKPAVALLLSEDSLENETVKIAGDVAKLKKLYSYMVDFDPYFNIIEP